MPYNALEWHVSVQMNVTKAGFSVSYIVLHTCGQPVPQLLISANVDNGTAAGIKRLRRLQTDRLRRAPGKGPLACRLLLPGCCFPAVASMQLVCLSLSPGLPRRTTRMEGRALNIVTSVILDFSLAVRANHLTVNMPLQICVVVPRLSGAAEMRGPARGPMHTSICGRVSTVR